MRNRPPKILVVSQPPYQPGGVPSQLRWLCKSIDSTGKYVTTILCTDRHLPENVDTASTVCAVPKLLRFTSYGIDTILCVSDSRTIGCQALDLADAFETIFEEFDAYQVVGGANLVGLGPARIGVPFNLWLATTLSSEYGAKIRSGLSRKQKVRSILYLLEYPRLRRWESFIFSKATSVFGISPFTVNTVIDAYPFVKSKCSWVPIPVDSSSESIHQQQPEPGRIIFAGRVSDSRKDLPTLLNAFALARNLNPRLRLVLIGGDMPPSLKKLMVNLGIEDSVESLGYVADANTEYARAEVMVIPAIQEGLNIAGLEAMAHAVPIVSTRCGGPECYVIDGQTGFLVPTRDPKSMADALHRLVSDSALRTKLGQQGKRLVAKQFAPENTMARFLEEFERLISLRTKSDRPGCRNNG